MGYYEKSKSMNHGHRRRIISCLSIYNNIIKFPKSRGIDIYLYIGAILNHYSQIIKYIEKEVYSNL